MAVSMTDASGMARGEHETAVFIIGSSMSDAEAAEALAGLGVAVAPATRALLGGSRGGKAWAACGLASDGSVLLYPAGPRRRGGKPGGLELALAVSGLPFRVA